MATAVDTNVLVRFLIDDGSDQVSAARSVFTSGPVSIPASVMLECEWVLRSAYRVPKKTISEALFRLLNMDTVTVADADIFERAIGAHKAGADFADAVHIFSSGCERFVTFDRDLLRRKKAFQEIEITKP